MLVQFTLSMPNCNSWNGRWTGEDNIYARVRNLTKKDYPNLEELLEKGYFTYRFDDGWCAGISVEKIDSKRASKIRKNTKGFYGYDWMITSILKDGYIHTLD